MTTASARVEHLEIPDAEHGPLRCARLVAPGGHEHTPVCLFLYGGGGGPETLGAIAPLLESWWQSGAITRMRVVTPDVGPWSFYLDDPDEDSMWESRIARSLSALAGEAPVAVVGISMGGYGALKLALARPERFAAVAAISPMIEPGTDARAVPLRNRFHYPPEVPQRLLGPERDAALWSRDHPASRARAHADALREGRMAIYLDAAGDDVFHAHDGAESLHRTLWELDVAHEHRLRAGSDHVGPDLVERLRDAFAFVSRALVPPSAAPLTELERSWETWLASDRSTPAPAMPEPTSPLFTRALRAQLEPARRAAAALDPTVHRRYGVL